MNQPLPRHIRSALIAALLGAFGCGPPAQSTGPDGGCVQPPESCPSSIPSYQSRIAAIVTSRCANCHVAGGSSASWQFTNYDQTFALRQETQSQVGSCLMPPANAEPLTTEDRTALLQWLVCGAPRN